MPIVAFYEDDDEPYRPPTPAEEIKDTAETLRTHIAYFIGNPNYRDMNIIIRIMERYEAQYTKHYEIKDEHAIAKENIKAKKKLDDFFYRINFYLQPRINWAALEEYDRWN